MSRTLKFRAWDKKNNRMLRVCSMSHGLMQGQTGWFITGEWTTSRPGGHSMVIKGEIVYDYIVDQYKLNIVDHILMQFTGLHDSQGKEIYEGDIFEIRENPTEQNEVEYFEGAWFLNPHGLRLPNYAGRGEVIGNIYESPDLLKEGV